jgi:hypothetical protein
VNYTQAHLALVIGSAPRKLFGNRCNDVAYPSLRKVLLLKEVLVGCLTKASRCCYKKRTRGNESIRPDEPPAKLRGDQKVLLKGWNYKQAYLALVV